MASPGGTQETPILAILAVLAGGAGGVPILAIFGYFGPFLAIFGADLEPPYGRAEHRNQPEVVHSRRMNCGGRLTKQERALTSSTEVRMTSGFFLPTQSERPATSMQTDQKWRHRCTKSDHI